MERKLNSKTSLQTIEEILDWNYFVSELTKVFRLNAFEQQQLKNSITAKIIAVIPFSADCKDANRTAIAHLCIYLTEIKGFQKYCAHISSDDKNLFKRLSLISNFEGGKQPIIEKGMNLLSYIMLEHYHETCEHDRKNDIYNPLNAGTWNYCLLKTSIEKEINDVYCPILDSLGDIFKQGYSSAW